MFRLKDEVVVWGSKDMIWLLEIIIMKGTISTFQIATSLDLTFTYFDVSMTPKISKSYFIHLVNVVCICLTSRETRKLETMFSIV